MTNDSSHDTWQAGRFDITLERPLVMGIVNVTPDSFSDGGQHAHAESAIRHCDQLLRQGADILDIGGESTRPGATAPSAEEELARVLPVVRHAVTLGCPVSVDSSEPRLMRAALDLGADIINDVRALRREGAMAVLAGNNQAGLCLMHMQGEPVNMQLAPTYGDVVDEVAAFLRERMDAVVASGVNLQRIVLDPGIGFGKSLEHNLLLTRSLPSLRRRCGRPLLVGWSRKGSLGKLTGQAVGDRQLASVAAALACVAQGAAIVRVHDVAETVEALKVWSALGPRPPKD